MNQSHKVSLTKEGYDELTAELKQIREEKLPKGIERVALARAHGDLSENSEYHSAREDLAFIEGKIDELDTLISKAVVIDTPSKKIIGVGSKVTVRVKDDQHTYDIVGEYEADPMQKKISHSSPLGLALASGKVGEEVEFEAPVGKVIYKIEKIH